MSIAVHRSIRLRLQRSNTLVIPSHLIIKVKNWLIINDDELFYVKLKCYSTSRFTVLDKMNKNFRFVLDGEFTESKISLSESSKIFLDKFKKQLELKMRQINVMMYKRMWLKPFNGSLITVGNVSIHINIYQQQEIANVYLNYV
jgi:hypothetical protein